MAVNQCSFKVTRTLRLSIYTNALQVLPGSNLGMDHMIILTEITYDLEVRPPFSMDGSIDSAHFLVEQ
jgi:hypothetical protein